MENVRINYNKEIIFCYIISNDNRIFISIKKCKNIINYCLLIKHINKS